MINIDTSYINLSFTPVKDYNDFISSGLPEIPKLKALVTSIKNVFKSQDANLQLYLEAESRIYRIDIFTSSRKKDLVGTVCYLSQQNQVHIWDGLNNVILASSRKKIIVNNIPYILNYIGASDRFKNIIQSV